VEKPITATAMAIEREGEQAVLCSVDLVSTSKALCAAVRAKVEGRSDSLDTEKIIISATHIHTGSGYAGSGINASSKYSGKANSFRALLEENLPADKKYTESANVSENKDIMGNDELLEFLSDKIAEAVITAWNGRKKATFSNAFGRAAVGMCRRAVYWGNTNTAVFTALTTKTGSKSRKSGKRIKFRSLFLPFFKKKGQYIL